MFSGVLCDEQSLGRGPGREGRGGVVGGGGGMSRAAGALADGAGEGGKDTMLHR